MGNAYGNLNSTNLNFKLQVYYYHSLNASTMSIYIDKYITVSILLLLHFCIVLLQKPSRHEVFEFSYIENPK